MNGTAAAARVRRAILQYGETVTLKRRPSTGTPFVETKLRGTVRSYNPQEIAGTLQSGDSEVLLSADGTVPRKGDVLLIQGRSWAVLGSEEIRLSDVPVAYRVHARGG